MKDKLQLLAQKVDAFSIRERILVLFAVSVVLIMSWLSIFMDPLQERQKAADQQIEKFKKTITSLEEQIEVINQRGLEDPDRENRALVAQLEQDVAKLDARIEQVSDFLIHPVQMTQAVHDIFERNKRLTLVKLESLPATGLLKIQNPLATNNISELIANVYKHDMIIELSGSYLDTVEYLKQMEQLPWNFSWDSVIFEVDEFPKSSVKIKLHTLSMDEGWVGV